jgi:hypothetical protein
MPFSTCFISIDRFFWAKTRVAIPIYEGSVDGGGINLRKFAKDGETSYLGQRPTWVFPLSVHAARRLQTSERDGEFECRSERIDIPR